MHKLSGIIFEKKNTKFHFTKKSQCPKLINLYCLLIAFPSYLNYLKTIIIILKRTKRKHSCDIIVETNYNLIDKIREAFCFSLLYAYVVYVCS